MGYVEAATTGPAVRPARGGQTAADTTAMPDGLPESAQNFASVFAMTRRSAWLDSLLDRNSKAINAREIQQRKTSDAFKAEHKQEPAGQAQRRERTKTSTRADRLRDSQTEHSTRTENAPRESQKSSEQARGRRSEQTDSNQRSLSEQHNCEPQAEQVPPCEAEQSAESQLRVESPLQEGAQPSTMQPPAATTVAVESVSTNNTGASSPGTATTAGLNLPSVVPTPNVSAGSATQTVTAVEPAAMPAQMAGGNSNEAGTGTPQDAAATGGAAKAGEASAKPGSASSEFSNLLGQVGRERAAAVIRQVAASAAKQAPAEKVQLTQPEAVEQLARVVRSNLGPRNSSMTLQLDPPELGHLRVDVRMHEQNLVLRFQVETQAARDVLETRLGELRQALQQHGIQLDRVEVSVRPPAGPDQQGPGPDGQPAQHDQPQGGEPPFGQSGGQQGGGQESYGSDSTSGQSQEAWSGNDPSVYQGLRVDEDGVPAETLVDLIV